MVFLGAASLSLSSILMILFVTTNNTPRFEETANEWQITRLTKQIADVNNLIITKPDHNGTEYMKANNRYQKAVAKKIQSQVDDLRAEQVRATLKRLYSKEPQRNWSIILFWSSLGLFIIAWVIKPSRTA